MLELSARNILQNERSELRAAHLISGKLVGLDRYVRENSHVVKGRILAVSGISISVQGGPEMSCWPAAWRAHAVPEIALASPSHVVQSATIALASLLLFKACLLCCERFA